LEKTRQQIILWIGTALFFVILLGGLTWGNYRYTVNNPGGNDFLVHWLGTRNFITQGTSPYSDETATAIQIFAYGHPAGPGEHELRVAYPLYSIVLFLPYALVKDFNLARALWMTTLEAGLIGLSLISIRLTGWKTKRVIFIVFMIFSILWYHGFRPLINGNAVILIALAITGALLALREKADELAGVLLAFSTIKPQVVILLIVFILFWLFKQKRWRAIGWFFTTLVLLIAASTLLMPDWILQNLREVIRYTSYNPPGTFGSALASLLPGIGQRIGWGMTAFLSLILLVEWRLSTRTGFRGFLWAACLTLVASQWIGIQTDPGNFIVLLPAMILVFSVLEERWKRAGMIFSIFSMVILFFGIWLIFLNTIQAGYQPQQSPVLFFPLPAFLLVTLYWVRWWSFRTPNVWLDDLIAQEDSGNS
jgi:hypothetical protein